MSSSSLAHKIHSALVARRNCLQSGNDYASTWDDRLDTIERELLPRGSGVDHGTKIDRDSVRDTSFALVVDFHHMDENGYYDGWSYHRITVSAAFDGFTLKLSGRNRNAIKDYLADLFHYDLSRQTIWDTSAAGVAVVESAAV